MDDRGQILQSVALHTEQARGVGHTRPVLHVTVVMHKNDSVSIQIETSGCGPVPGTFGLQILLCRKCSQFP